MGEGNWSISVVNRDGQYGEPGIPTTADGDRLISYTWLQSTALGSEGIRTAKAFHVGVSSRDSAVS